MNKKIHRKYLFNKINIIIICLTIFLLILSEFIIINPTFNKNNVWLERPYFNEYFLEDTKYVYKFIFIFFTSLFFTNAFIRDNDRYIVLFIRKRVDRCIVFFNKLSCLIEVLLLIYITINIINTFVLFLSKPYIFDIFILFKNTYHILLNSLTYGFIALVLVLLFPTYFVCMIPIGLYILTEIIENKDLIIFIILPESSNDSLIAILIKQLIYIIISVILYYKKNIL